MVRVGSQTRLFTQLITLELTHSWKYDSWDLLVLQFDGNEKQHTCALGEDYV